MSWTDRVMEEARRVAAKRVRNACIECVKDLKLIVGVPAPRKVSKKSGRIYAKTKATPGAPPRKLTGRGRASISYRVEDENGEPVGRVGTNVVYMPVHELGTKARPGGLHKFVEPTMARNGVKYRRILAGE